MEPTVMVDQEKQEVPAAADFSLAERMPVPTQRAGLLFYSEVTAVRELIEVKVKEMAVSVVAAVPEELATSNIAAEVVDFQVVAAEVMVMPRSRSCSIQSMTAVPSCTSPIL